MASPAGDPIDPDQFTVYLPDIAGARVLCAEISSRDGRYHAAIEYDLTGVTSGARRLGLRVPCFDLEGTSTTFNLRCDLDRALLTPATRLFVVRRRGTRTLAPVALPLRLPQ